MEEKNVVSVDTSPKDKGTSSVESEGICKEATLVETKDTEIKDDDMNLAKPEADAKTKSEDSAQPNVDEKKETTAENTEAGIKKERKTLAGTLKKGVSTFQRRWRSEVTVKMLQNEIGDGNWNGVMRILLLERDMIKEEINSDGNTVLHIAVGIGHNYFVEHVLFRFGELDLTQVKNSHGSTVLHIAAIVGNTDAAKIFVISNKNLLHLKDHKGQTPLHKAYENMHLDTIAYLLEAGSLDKSKKSVNIVGQSQEAANVDPGSNNDADECGTSPRAAYLSDNSLLPLDIGVNLLVNAISAKKYDFAINLMTRNPEYAVSNDNALLALATTFPSGLDYWEALLYPSLDDISESILERTKRLFHILVYPSSYIQEMKWRIISFLNCEHGFKNGVRLILHVPVAMVWWIFSLIILLLLMIYFPFFMIYLLLWKVAAGLDVPLIENIEQKMRQYEKATKVLELVCNKIMEYTGCGYDLENKPIQDLYSRPILEAACQDAYEVVDVILDRWPEAIRCSDTDDYDIIQLAVIHRSEKVYNLIYIIEERKSIYGTIEDYDGNNMLHLVGKLAPSNKLKLRTGASLQLQSELQWREEVEKLVFPAYVTKVNVFDKTPEMVFTKEHENLVKEGEKWIKAVAESCSITAALITTIVFAAAITVPGGSTQETGIPVFTKNIAFNIFAAADAISLFSSVTSLLVFVSILTTRFAEQDFLFRLPRRLIIGLCTLLLSTTAMMVAFSATLFLVFSHHKVWMLAPICGLSCLPIAIFFIIQVPLIVDLYRSTYISKFGKSKNINHRFDPNHIRFLFGK